MEESVKLCDGKYEFYMSENGCLYCKRNGEEWRDFIGDKAIRALFDEVIRLREIDRSCYEECHKEAS